MKKGILTFAVLVVSRAMMGQVSLGAKAGVNYNIWTEKDSEALSGVGFHLGGYAKLPISENLIFQPELMYSARGIREMIEESITYTDPVLLQITQRVEVDLTARVGYLEVPLLLGVAAAEGLNIHVGPVLALRMGYYAEYDYSYTETTATGTTGDSWSGSSTNDAVVNLLHFGAAVGSTYELESGLSFGLRYTRGFTSVYENYDYPVIYNGLQFSVGYLILKN
jgi:hypothetical protein